MNIMIVNGKMLTVQEHEIARRKATPADASVCYNELHDRTVPDQPVGMEIVRKHTLYFRGGNPPATEEKFNGPNRAVMAEHVWELLFLIMFWISGVFLIVCSDNMGPNKRPAASAPDCGHS